MREELVTLEVSNGASRENGRLTSPCLETHGKPSVADILGKYRNANPVVLLDAKPIYKVQHLWRGLERLTKGDALLKLLPLCCGPPGTSDICCFDISRLNLPVGGVPEEKACSEFDKVDTGSPGAHDEAPDLWIARRPKVRSCLVVAACSNVNIVQSAYPPGVRPLRSVLFGELLLFTPCVLPARHLADHLMG